MPAQPQISPSIALLVLVLSLGVISAVLASWTWLILRVAEGRPRLPREPRRVVPWGALSVIALIVLYLALTFILGAGYALVQYLRLGQKPGSVPLIDLLLIDALAKLFMVVLAPVVLRITSGAQLADLGITGRDFGKNLLRGVWLCFLMLPVVYSLSFVATRIVKPTSHPIEKAIREMQSPNMAIVAGLAAVVAAPIAEELLFRGVLLGWFWKVGLRKRREEDSPVLVQSSTDPFSGDVDPFAASIRAEPLMVVDTVQEPSFEGRGRHDLLANVAVSFIFAGLHAQQWPAPVPLFVLSLALGEVYRRTGSLVAPIALHATFNGLSTTAMFLLLGVDGGLPKP